MSKKQTFSMNKWKDYRLRVMKEASGELNEAGSGDVSKLADAITRVLLSVNPKVGLVDITKYQGVIRDYVDAENFDDISNYLYKELRDVLTDTMRRAAAGR